MTDTVTLKPCPFDGHDAKSESQKFCHPPKHWVKCTYCGASTDAYSSADSARRAWNTRDGGAATPMRESSTASSVEYVEKPGRFADYSTESLAAQCRMQARENLDLEYSQFMTAVADRLLAIAHLESEARRFAGFYEPNSDMANTLNILGNKIAALALSTAQEVDETELSVIDEIAAERRRQIEAEGWTPEHDDEHGYGELSRAAACYAAHASAYQRVTVPLSAYQSADAVRREYGWPWNLKWWKPTTPRRDLVKAAALIVAEIERLDRAAIAKARGAA